MRIERHPHSSDVASNRRTHVGSRSVESLGSLGYPPWDSYVVACYASRLYHILLYHLPLELSVLCLSICTVLSFPLWTMQIFFFSLLLWSVLFVVQISCAAVVRAVAYCCIHEYVFLLSPFRHYWHLRSRVSLCERRRQMDTGRVARLTHRA
ncbi:hypothetical protein C8Q73DRAFT_157833 [Cubamyces lactineus]|nr:hypothetical protein C8Q73DRAFT_157833 [Cubamyces lactineus]